MKALPIAASDITEQLRKRVSRGYARRELTQAQMNRALRLIKQLNEVLAPQDDEDEEEVVSIERHENVAVPA